MGTIPKKANETEKKVETKATELELAIEKLKGMPEEDLKLFLNGEASESETESETKTEAEVVVPPGTTFMTEAQFMAAAPPAIKKMVEGYQRQEATRKNTLVKSLSKLQSRFNADQLKKKSVDDLEDLFAMLKSVSSDDEDGTSTSLPAFHVRSQSALATEDEADDDDEDDSKQGGSYTRSLKLVAKR